MPAPGNQLSGQHLVGLLINRNLLITDNADSVRDGDDCAGCLVQHFNDAIKVEFPSLLNDSGNLCGFLFHVWVLVFWVCGLLA